MPLPTLSPATKGFLEMFHAAPRDDSLEATRFTFEQLYCGMGYPAPECNLMTHDLFIDSSHDKAHKIPIRIYVPETSDFLGPNGEYPGFVYAHGGGWTLGSVKSHDSFCQTISNLSGAVVISVDYRLAPEHPFPAAYMDILDICLFFTSRRCRNVIPNVTLDHKRVGIGGDSAGGNLTAAVMLYACQVDPKKSRFLFSALMCPVVSLDEYSNLPEDECSSVRKFATDHFLTYEDMVMFNMCYTGQKDEILSDYRCTPMKFFENPTPILSSPPPCLMVYASHDMLKDSNVAFALQLSKMGTSVTSVEFDGFHVGWLMANATGMEQSAKLVNKFVTFMKFNYMR